MIHKLFYFAVLSLTLNSTLWADSTNVFRVKSSNQPVPKTQVYSPGIEIKTANVQNNDFQNLPNCMELKGGKYVERVFNCPDINGKLATMQAKDINGRPIDVTVKNCPDVCVLNRTPESDWDIVHNPTLTIINPQCPQGYVQTATFNMQREFKYSNSKSFYPANDEELADYKGRVGYACSVSRGTELTIKKDGTCQRALKNTPDYPAGYEFTDTLNNRSYKFRLAQWTQVCYRLTSCEVETRRTTWTEVPASSNTPNCDGGAAIFYYSFKPIICFGPAGNYSTGNLVPTSIVCSRVQPVWNKS